MLTNVFLCVKIYFNSDEEKQVGRVSELRETAVGASRRQVVRDEDHSRVADANQVVSVDSLGVTEARID